MRRLATASIAFVAMTGTLLVLPVYAAPVPSPEPVEASLESVPLGSVDQPVGEAVITQDGEPVEQAPQEAPAGESATPGAEPSAPPVPPEEPSSEPSAPTESSIPAEPSAPVEPSAPAEDGGDGATSGDEVPGVPALTVSQPDVDRFSTVGVTWSLDETVGDVLVQVRVRDRDGAWSDWSDLEPENMDVVDPGSARGGTSPYWVGDSYGVEVVVQATGGSAPEDVRLQLIDPGDSPADAVTTPAVQDQAGAAMRMPPIHTRAQWGADERIRTWDPTYASTLKAATVHHTAGGNDYTADQVPQILRSTYTYHAQSLGWGDIGYNVLVDKYGRLWEGRYGGLASTVIGAHAGGFNDSTFGVSMMGDYDKVQPTQAMLDAVASVIAWKFSLYGVDPRGTTTLVSAGGGTSRYAKGEAVSVPTIFAHRDVGQTVCPGQYGYAKMPGLRNTVAAYMADLSRYEPAEAWALHADGRVTGVGRGNPGDVPLACDWNGDGRDTVGLFRRGTFILFDSDDRTARITAQFGFGNPGDTPLCGDWDGDGIDTVAVWRAGWFYLRNSNRTGAPDAQFAFGNVTDRPLAGNWDGDPFDTVGVQRGASFYWANSNLRLRVDGQAVFGLAGDRAVIGDWNGDGRDDLGVARQASFFLAGRTPGRPYDQVWFGNPSDRPLAGDWDGTGRGQVGVSRGY